MSFLSVLFGKKSDADTLLDDILPLREESRFQDEDDEAQFIAEVMEEAGTEFDATLGMRIGLPVFRLLSHLLSSEPFAMSLEDGEPEDLAEGVAYRNKLRTAKKMFEREGYYLSKWQEAITAILASIYRELPAQAFVDPDENGDFEEYSRLAPTAYLFTYIKDVPLLVQKIVATIFARDLQSDGLFADLRDQLFINCAIASKIPVEERYTTNKQFVLPKDKKGLTDEELILLYLSHTPFIDIFAVEIPIYIPEAVRFEHTHILAGTGHGKTQTLQFLIAGDLEEALQERRSVVVMDSQGDLLDTLMHSQYFKDSYLRERFIYINPKDLERPVGLNLFDVDLSGNDPVIRETILNGTIEIYEYFFGGLLGADLTQKQGVVFRYIAILLIRIPNATIHTFLDLMANGEKYKPYMKTLAGSARTFFETRFFDRTFSETKKQIVTRLWGVLSSQTLDRMMSATKNSVDLFQSLQNGSIIFINTAKDFLGHEGSSIFSRMFMALLNQALVRRASIPKHERTPTYIYVDEAEDVVDVNLTCMLTQVRKYKGAMTFAHQNLDQLPPDIRAGVLTNTSIKLAGGLSAKDAHTLAPDFRTDADFLLSQRKDKHNTYFACFAKNVTDHAVTLAVPLGFLEQEERLSDKDFQSLVNASRRKYGVEYVEAVAEEPEPTDSPSDWLGEETTPAPKKKRQPEKAVTATEPKPLPEPMQEIQAEQEQVEPALIRIPTPTPEIQITRAPPKEELPYQKDSGGGGVKHKYIEHLIKELGEERDFRATIEESIHDGAGRVDVVLRREEVMLAFEISVTTTRDHELGNIEKCLALPYTHIVMLASHAKHLKSLSMFIGQELDDDEKKRVSFLLPEDLPGFLDGFRRTQPPKDKTVKGYTVRSKVKDSDPSEAIARRKAVAQVVARSMER